jgi:hypothetical protein
MQVRLTHVVQIVAGAGSRCQGTRLAGAQCSSGTKEKPDGYTGRTLGIGLTKQICSKGMTNAFGFVYALMPAVCADAPSSAGLFPARAHLAS